MKKKPGLLPVGKADYGGMDVSQAQEAKQLGVRPHPLQRAGFPKFHTSMSMRRDHGFTLLELIVAATILSLLTLMALPLAQLTIKREKEKRLRHALWEMRDAIDRYKDLADRAAGFRSK
jgi:prepilin-type N-terminal cleavage/methylation domain-containing protein